MIRNLAIAAATAALSLLAPVAASYDWVAGNASVALSSAVYCNPDTYMSRTYVGYAKGFVPTAHIHESVHGTEGFVGYMSSHKAIYVVYRGSSNIKNWVANLDAILTNYNYCSGCEVHLGFSNTMNAAYPQVLSAVKSLRQQFPDYEVIATGHSLGAALATLTALELQHSGIANVRTVHFGCPRVGNTNFANWATSALGPRSARNTHHKDMVPHCPMHERFTHVGNEYYEDPVLQLRTCSGLEDPECSYQWHVTSIDDHMLYLNKEMGADGCV